RPENIEGCIEINDVDSHYTNGLQALKNVSMVVQPNQNTALVGLSGAGKSTVINLLDKFYSPTKGQILLDGVDLADYDTAYLREHVGLVLQKNHIFKGSIAENIRYGKTDASMDEIKVAA